jgi:hypothetical protein
MTKLNAADVQTRFALLSGLDDGAQKYLPLCSDAADEIERGEKEGCGAEASGPLTAAAAALAFYRFALTQAGGSAGSFTAGDVKISAGTSNVQPAWRIWREAAAAASPYLADSRFLFERTRP